MAPPSVSGLPPAVAPWQQTFPGLPGDGGQQECPMELDDEVGVISFETLHGYGGMHPGAGLMSLAPRPAPYAVPAELRGTGGQWGTLVSSTRTEGLHAEVAQREHVPPPHSLHSIVEHAAANSSAAARWGSHSSEAKWLLEQKDKMNTIGEVGEMPRWTPTDGEIDSAF